MGLSRWGRKEWGTTEPLLCHFRVIKGCLKAGLTRSTVDRPLDLVARPCLGVSPSLSESQGNSTSCFAVT